MTAGRLKEEGPERSLVAAYALLARLSIRADRPGAELAARVMDAVAYADPALVPVLRYGDAVSVGEKLARQWQFLVGDDAPDSEDLVWADLVQFVLRHARDRVATIAAGRAATE